MKSITWALLGSFVVLLGADGAKKEGYVPKEGFVPTQEVAIKIAVAIWEPIYGADHIAGEKPYQASLKQGVWTVSGSLPPEARGGVAVAEISQGDGRILGVSHGK